MGNSVSASTDIPPFPPPPTNFDMDAMQPKLEIPVVTNPGSYEELFNRPRTLFPQAWDGLRLNVNKGLSSNFQVSHQIHLSGGPQGSVYKFSPTYVGGTPDKPQDANPVILAEMDGTGSLTAQVIYNWFKSLKSKLVVQTQQDIFAMIQGDAEYKSSCSTSTLTLGNIDILKDSGIVVLHHLHRVTPNVDVGAEYLYQHGQQAGPTGSSAVLTLAARYSAPSWCFTGSANQMGTHFAYYQKANENIQAGVDFEFNSRMQDSTVSLIYQVDVPKANVTFRALADTNWTVSSVFEKRLDGLPFTLSFCGMLNHVKNSAKFGLSVQIG